MYYKLKIETDDPGQDVQNMTIQTTDRAYQLIKHFMLGHCDLRPVFPGQEPDAEVPPQPVTESD